MAIYYGTEDNDVITGTSFDDTIEGIGGDDRLFGRSGDDTISGGSGNDILYGEDGNDRLEGNDGNDTIYGGVGNDSLDGGLGNDILSGGWGADTMIGGLGNDSYYVDNTGDFIFEETMVNQGIDKVYASVTFNLNPGVQSLGFVENVTLVGNGNINAIGNELNNAIAGNDGNNSLNGGAGNDTISGYGGNDIINGQLGSDRLQGGAGDDKFVFNSSPNGIVDTIVDFTVGDDEIWLDNDIFGSLGSEGGLTSSAFHTGAVAHDSTDRVIYNSETGALFYDSNGSSAGGAMQIAQLSAGLNLDNSDFLIV